MNVVAIIQARVGSTRLPGKVLRPLAGKSMLAQVVQRTQWSRRISKTVVATTDCPADDAIASLCDDLQISYFRGSEVDVLDRYYQAAKKFQSDAVVRITSDCPLIDPGIVDDAVAAFQERQPGLDYLTTFQFPRGLDTEVFSFSALGQAWREDTNPAWREHVAVFIYRNPNRFQIGELRCTRDLSHLRWTVDTPEDFELVGKIYEYFGHNRFSWLEALAAVEAHPDWSNLNCHIRQKTISEK